MKIFKYRFPRLSLPSRPSANQTHLPPSSKKTLLIGIQSIRQEAVKITQEDDDERTAEEDVTVVPKRKKKKDKEEASKAAELKGPHRDERISDRCVVSISFRLRNGILTFVL
jgi:hypothetical protein